MREFTKNLHFINYTIDKFASITWLDEAISMFDNDKFSKPDLVIQDELHLISGPLGSLQGCMKFY